MIDITGRRYGKLVVIRPAYQNKEKRWIWECRCDCGGVGFYPKNTLDYGKRTSCGCDANKTPNLIHGGRYLREYRIWQHIKRRCLNKKSKDYKRYGAKGITVYKEWVESFETFLEDMGLAPSEKHQIERINTLKGYSKQNCIWATLKQNCCNRTTSYIWNIKGEVFESATDAARRFNVSDYTIHRWCKGGRGIIKKHDCNCYARY